MLKPLATIKAPDLINFDRQSYVDEIIERIKLNSDWSSIWNDELYQNADQMIMQFFAYMFEKNALNFNFNIKEKFLAHAFSDEAIYQGLSDRGISVSQAKNASVDVVVSLDNYLLKEPLVFDKYYSVEATNINNTIINFEVIEKDDDGKYKYLDNVIINPEYLTIEYFTMTLYAGKTYYETFEISATTLENMQLKLSYNDIEDGSIRAYFKDPDGKIVELNEVDILNTTGEINNIFPNGTPSFKVKYDKNNYPVIMFGTEEFGGAFESDHVNGEIIVFYRTAYGESSNILSGGINSTQTVSILNNDISIIFTNNYAAAGGKDVEDLIIAKEYGPLRLGRNGAFIDERDAQIALQRSVVKHEIDTPQIYEASDITPFLHATHFIVPIRDFTDFEFIDIESTDTIEIYEQSIITQFTEYCKISGAHDKKVSDEYVSDFVYPDDDGKINFTYILKNLYPLSGTLRASAFDENDKIVDYIRWDDNYIINTKSSTATHDKVTRIRSKTFATITIIDNLTGTSSGTNNGKNNKLIIEFDDYDHIFELTLPLGIKTYKEFATIINNLIINEIKGQYSTTYDNDTRGAITNMLHLIDHTFVSYEVVNSSDSTGRLIFNSTKTGRKSKIIFHNYNIENTNNELDLYYMLGVGVYTYRPGRETGWVFNDNITFNYNTNEIFFDIYSDNISKEQIVEYSEFEDNMVQSLLSALGPQPEFILTVENNIKEKLLIGYDINIFAEKYNSVSQEYDVISHIIFENIEESAENYAAIGSQDPRVLDTDANSVFDYSSDNNVYDYDNSLLKLQIINGLSQPYYVPSYGEINKIILQEVTVVGSGSSRTFNDVSSGLKKIFLPDGDEWVQDVSSSIGVKFDLDFQGTDLTDGKSYKLSFIYINSALEETVTDFIVFENIDADATSIAYTYITESPVAEVISRSLASSSIGTYINGSTKIIKIATTNPEADDNLNTYISQWADFDRIRITYSSKNFDHISVNYVPNKYSPEGEAKSLLSTIKDSGSRLIGVENTIKNISYIPFGLTIVLKINKKYPLYEAVNAVKNTIYGLYKYDNTNTEHTINTKPTAEIIKSNIDEIASTYGIISSSVESSITEYVEKFYTDPCYFFIMDDTLFNNLLSLENDSSNDDIKTISNNYKININATFGA